MKSLMAFSVEHGVWLQAMQTKMIFVVLLLGDICRHSKEYIKFTTKLPVSKSFTTVTDVAKTTGTIEERFNVLKNVRLSGRSRSRLDEFSQELVNEHILLQKSAADRYIKDRHKIKRLVKATKTVIESWDKKGYEPEYLQKKSGKYQQKPKKTLKSTEVLTGALHTQDDKALQKPVKATHSSIHLVPLQTQHCSFCPMKNLSSSCWFNAMLQVLCQTEIITILLERIPDEDFSTQHNLTQASKLLELFRFFAPRGTTASSVQVTTRSKAVSH